MKLILSFQSLIKILRESIYPFLIIILRIFTSFLLILVVSKNNKIEYNLFSIDYSFIGIFLVFGNFYIQKSAHSKGGKSNTFWLLTMLIITSCILIIRNNHYYILPISLNLVSQYFLSLDYSEKNERYQKNNLILLSLQLLFLLFSFRYWFSYKFLLFFYLSLPLFVTFRIDLLSKVSFDARNLKSDLHMIFWILAQSFCFPVAFYFFRVYLGNRNFSLIEFDLLQKFLLVPSLLFGSILSSRLYILDLSEDIFNFTYKPFRIFLFLTFLYFILGIMVVLYFSIYTHSIFKTFSIPIILFFVVIELLKFVYGHLANFFYFLGSSVILLILEIAIAIVWVFSTHLDIEINIVLINIIIIYIISILIVNYYRKFKIKLTNL